MSKKIEICLSNQCLSLLDRDKQIFQCSVSTAANGAGEQMDSECTPRGHHVIADKFGSGCESNTVFVGRQATGEVYTPALGMRYPNRDWVLTRILWLSGTELGRNQGGQVDSQSRYVYIHGAPDAVEMGILGSRGCVRMKNKDIIWLFDQVEIGCPVLIDE